MRIEDEVDRSVDNLANLARQFLAERDEARAALRLIYCHINSDGIPILRNTQPGDFQIIAKAYRNADPFPKIQFPKL